MDAGRVHLWLVDREGDALLGLDAAGAVVRTVGRARPVRVARSAQGDLWVAGADGVVARLDALGAELAAVRVGAVLDLTGLPCGDALALVRRGENEDLVRVERGGAVRTLGGVPGATWLVARGGEVLVGGADLRVVDVAGAALLARLPVRARAGAAAADGWWTLDDPGDGTGTRLVRWSRRLGRRGVRSLPSGAAALAASPGGEGAGAAWVVAGDAGWVLRPDGLRIELAPLPDVRALCADADGLWILLPGAVLRLDPSGRVAATQGGFHGLVDLVPVAG
jgi:hypothetical protein